MSHKAQLQGMPLPHIEGRFVTFRDLWDALCPKTSPSILSCVRRDGANDYWFEEIDEDSDPPILRREASKHERAAFDAAHTAAASIFQHIDQLRPFVAERSAPEKFRPWLEHAYRTVRIGKRRSAPISLLNQSRMIKLYVKGFMHDGFDPKKDTDLSKGLYVVFFEEAARAFVASHRSGKAGAPTKHYLDVLRNHDGAGLPTQEAIALLRKQHVRVDMDTNSQGKETIAFDGADPILLDSFARSLRNLGKKNGE